MKEITLFIQPGCPFCKMALAYINDLQKIEKYKEIKFDVVDELVEVDRADSFDYYYVPTFYFGKKKIHEGSIYKDEVKVLLDSILEQ